MRRHSLPCALVVLGALCAGLHLGQDAGSTDPIRFEDVTERSGVRFIARNSATGKKHQIETMLSGVAVFDYNNDGRSDIYFVNGARIPELIKTGPEYHNRLYRNNPDGTFTDVTIKAGVAGQGYGMGVAAGDYDNDGFVDLFLPGVDRNILYRNRGDGVFQDVTSGAGLAGVDPARGKPWSIAAGWFDYDNDGYLDLFVVNYCSWRPDNEPVCGNSEAGYRTYCHPDFYEGLPNSLFRNNGDGTFTDVSKVSGIASKVGKGMGVAFADYDHDSDLDVFVANDNEPNFLFRNDGRGKFTEIGLSAGVAYTDAGQAISSMGADFRDYDNDGQEDVFVSALVNETFPLFRNLGQGFFLDATGPSLMGKATRHASGWSTGIYDLNNDGYKDIFVAGGHVQDNVERYSSLKSKQGNIVIANLGKGRFADVSRRAGNALSEVGLHRGLAFGDFNADGRVDAVVTRLNDRAKILMNTSPEQNHWLAFRLTGRRTNRDAIGARIHIVGESGLEQWNHVTTSVGLSSSSEKTVFFGLGKDTTAKIVQIEWPGGARQELRDVRIDRRLDLEEPAAR